MLKRFLVIILALLSLFVVASAATTTTTVFTTTTISPTNVINVVANPSVETANSKNANQPLNWSTDHWGTNNAIFTYLKSFGHSGTHSLEVQIPATKGSNDYSTFGDAKWVFNSITVKPGDTYDFSDWYQSNIISEVVVYFTNNGIPDYYMGLRTAPVTTNGVLGSSNWSHYSESFVVPYKAKTMTVYHLINTSGTLITDDYALNKITPQGFNRPIVSLTFDNCWENNTYTVLPILKNNSWEGTFYISTVFTNNTVINNKGLTGIQAIKDIFADGDEVASHSVDHSVSLTNASPAEINYQLTASKAFLGNIVGIANVTDYATPFGDYNDIVVNDIKPIYSSHRTTDEGYNTKENFDPYRLIVQNMLNDTTNAEFGSWINETIKTNSWLILVYHCVKPTKAGLSDYDTPQPDFAPQMAILKNSGVTVETVAQALAEVEPQMTNTTTTTSTTTSSTTTSSTTSSTSIATTTSSSTTTSLTTTLPTTSLTSTATTTSSSTTESTSISSSITTTSVLTTTIPSTTTTILTTIPTTTTIPSTTSSTTSVTTTSISTSSTTTVPASCSGTPTVTLSPNPAATPTTKITATVSGITNCAGTLVTIKDYKGCTSGATLATFTSNAIGGSVAIPNPGATGKFGYFALVNGKCSAKAILTVN